MRIPGMPHSLSFFCIFLKSFKPFDFFIGVKFEGVGGLTTSWPPSSLLCEHSLFNGLKFDLGNIGGRVEAMSGESKESWRGRNGVGIKCFGRRGLAGGVDEHEEGGEVSLRSAGVSRGDIHEPEMSFSLQTTNKISVTCCHGNCLNLQCQLFYYIQSS